MHFKFLRVKVQKSNLARDGPLFLSGGGTFFVKKKLFANFSWMKKLSTSRL